MFATPGLDPGGATRASGLDIDAEHGSGTANPEGIELRCVNPLGEGGKESGRRQRLGGLLNVP
jgi:hypothetical protein